jgi:hypothetical protein
MFSELSTTMTSLLTVAVYIDPNLNQAQKSDLVEFLKGQTVTNQIRMSANSA